MSVAWNKSDPTRSLKRFINNFADDPGWALRTLAMSLEFKALGPVLGPLGSIGISLLIYMMLIGKWKDAFGWGGYRPGFDEIGFSTNGLIVAVILAIIILIIGRITSPSDDKPGLEKFALLIVTVAPMCLLGPWDFWGLTLTVAELILGSVALAVIAWRTMTNSSIWDVRDLVAQVIPPIILMLFVLWTTSLLATVIAILPSVASANADGGLLPRYNSAAATATIQASATIRSEMVATREVDWCKQNCTPIAATRTAAALWNSGQPSPATPPVSGTRVPVSPTITCPKGWVNVRGVCVNNQ